MIIYAFNIHQGGGKVLLLSLLDNLQTPCVFFGDARLVLSQALPAGVSTVSVKPSILSRLFAEMSLWRFTKTEEKVLCFGNLPPLLPSAGRVSLYFQNTILFGENVNLPFSWKAKLKHSIERLWLRWGIRHIETVFVQSEVVRSDFLKEYPKANVVVAPFMPPLPRTEAGTDKNYDFVYVASGDPHKNHMQLLRAWEMLAENGLYPSLALTLSENDKLLLSKVVDLKQKGIKIYNLPNLAHAQVLNLYAESRALIFPSITESFGLPLLEAKAVGIPIIASELDYVREVVSPVQTFDPQSAKSIVRAVQRFLGLPSDLQGLKVLSPIEFLELVNK